MISTQGELNPALGDWISNNVAGNEAGFLGPPAERTGAASTERNTSR
jgi:hypothetical protein